MPTSTQDLNTREHHYSPSTGQSQYWEWSAAGGWHIVDNYEAGDWPVRTYRYVTWPGDIPTPPKPGMPPRATW